MTRAPLRVEKEQISSLLNPFVAYMIGLLLPTYTG